jgi:hypothetical protein
MEQFQWDEEAEQRKEQYLKRHERMAKLFVEDRLTFERERKRLLDEFFNGIEDEGMRGRLRALQASFEKRMKNAGSAHNRFVLAQTFFWDHFHNIWQPGLARMNDQMKSFAAKAALINDHFQSTQNPSHNR